MFDTAHREDSRRHLLTLEYLGSPEKIDGLLFICDRALLHILEGDDTENAVHTLQLGADWFELPHPPECRDPQGEVDFIALRLVCALFEPRCLAVLPAQVKDSFRRFFTRRDFKSMHTSENHYLIFRVTRRLAAQYYAEAFF